MQAGYSLSCAAGCECPVLLLPAEYTACFCLKADVFRLVRFELSILAKALLDGC